MLEPSTRQAMKPTREHRQPAEPRERWCIWAGDQIAARVGFIPRLASSRGYRSLLSVISGILVAAGLQLLFEALPLSSADRAPSLGLLAAGLLLLLDGALVGALVWLNEEFLDFLADIGKEKSSRAERSVQFLSWYEDANESAWRSAAGFTWTTLGAVAIFGVVVALLLALAAVA